MYEYTSCLVCGSREYRTLYESTIGEEESEIDPRFFSVFEDKRHGQIVSCRRCGFVFVNPREDQSKFLEAYRRLSPKEYLLEKENRKLIFEENLNLIEKHVERRGKLLDIGCSVGLFLNVAMNRGWDVKGVEISAQNAAFAREHFNLDVISGNIKDLNFERASFDVITLWDVLEHLQDPGVVMTKVHSVLRNHGLCVLNTPNIGSNVAKRMGEKWLGIVRMHLYYFNKETLTMFLLKHGFKIVYEGTYRRVFTVKYIVQKLSYHSKPFGRLLDIILLKVLNLGEMKMSIDLYDGLTVIAKKL